MFWRGWRPWPVLAKPPQTSLRPTRGEEVPQPGHEAGCPMAGRGLGGCGVAGCIDALVRHFVGPWAGYLPCRVSRGMRALLLSLLVGPVACCSHGLRVISYLLPACILIASL